MNLTPEDIKKVFKHYSEIEEAVEKIALAVWRLHHPYREGSSSHHGGPNATFEKFYVEGNNIEVTLDTGCCGSYDNDYITFPASYLYEEWQPIEEKKIADEKVRRERIDREREEKRLKEVEEMERKTYERLKKKFE